jgi:hypothetical protein
LSTQRNPSSFELTALQRVSISSSAPAQLESQNHGIFIIPGAPASASIAAPPHRIHRHQSINNCSTTQLAIQRIDLDGDTYIPGTDLERTYMKSAGLLKTIWVKDASEAVNTIANTIESNIPGDIEEPANSGEKRVRAESTNSVIELEGFDEFGDEVDTQDLLEIDELLQARAKDQEASSILAQKPGGNDNRHYSTLEIGSTKVSQSTSLSQAQTLGGIDDRPCSTPEMGSAKHGQGASLSQAQKPGGIDGRPYSTPEMGSAEHSQSVSLSQA